MWCSLNPAATRLHKNFHRLVFLKLTPFSHIQKALQNTRVAISQFEAVSIYKSMERI